MDIGFYGQITKLNNCLRTKEIKKKNNPSLRKLIENKAGLLIPIKDDPAVIDKYSKRGILGVDGSVNSEGAAFPFVLSFFRGVAMNTKELPKAGRKIVTEEIFSPLKESDLTILIRQAVKDGQTIEMAFQKYHLKRMAEIELITAIEGISEFKTDIILMDGGFVRFEILAPELWADFKAFCLELDVLAVGVIEEVSTSALANILGDKSLGKDYDREILYGLLEPREYLKIKEDLEIKKGYYSAFARLSNHPQVIGVDLFTENKEQIGEVMPLLAGLTPAAGRGIPLWLDIVDREARITRKEVDLYMGCIDLDIREKFMMAQHNRRQY